MSIEELFLKIKGSSTSGNYGHSGRPGKRGGSAGGGFSAIGAKRGMSKDEITQARDKKKSSGKTDEYGRKIVSDEYGSYSLPTEKSKQIALQKRNEFRQKSEELAQKRNQLQQKLENLQSKVGDAVVAATRKRGRDSMLGDGRSSASIAPKTRDKVKDTRRQIEEIEKQNEKLLAEWHKTRSDLEAELAEIGD